MIRFLLFLIVKMAGASHQANSYLKIGHFLSAPLFLSLSFSKELAESICKIFGPGVFVRVSF